MQQGDLRKAPARNVKPLASLLEMKLDGAWLLRTEIYLLILIQFLTNIGMLPTSITYLFDLANILIMLFGYRSIGKAAARFTPYVATLLGYICFAVVTGFGAGVSPACIVWELMIQMRIPIFILLCISYWSIEDVKLVFRHLMWLQPINLLFAASEYFALGLSGDNCGGVFGVTAGSNMMLNMYLVLVTAYAASCYLGVRGSNYSLGAMVATLTMSFFVATLAEIKFFYLEACVAVAIAMIASRKSHRMFLLAGVFMGALALGLTFLAVYFPDSFDMLFDIDALRAYDDGSNVATSGYGISRAGAIGQINDLFFGNNVADRMVGYGFGSATMSSIPVFCSPFYWAYGWLKYYYSQIAMLYLQNGYIGLIFYFVIHLLPIIYAFRFRIRFEDSSWSYVFSICIGVMFVLNCFYNGSSRSYAALLWAVCFAIPFVVTKDQTAKTLNYEVN